MKTILKISLLILSISLVNCKKNNQYDMIELENESAIVRKITDVQDYIAKDELLYLELVNPHAKLSYTTLNINSTINGYDYVDLDEILGQYKKEGLAVKISGIILVRNPKTTAPFPDMPINGIYFHYITLYSIEADE